MTIQEFDFFSHTDPPSNLGAVSDQVKDFLNFHEARGNLKSRKIVLVTSGGTTVPLEANTVRFIDNFSAGTRGSVSAEHFLHLGYLVIFLHRDFSLLPFVSRFGRVNFMDMLSVEETTGQAKVVLDETHVEKLNENNALMSVLKEYHTHKAERNILLLSFTTITEYLFILRQISQDLDTYFHGNNPHVMLYLAAAVSDFFIPQYQLPQHKIQSNMAIIQNSTISSSDGKLVLNLDPVPKFLKNIVSSWFNSSFVVSFKLETDDSLLYKKCTQALDKYEHQLVIGNLLQSRKDKVVFVTKRGKSFGEHWFFRNESAEIESVFIPEVIRLHDSWIQAAKQAAE